MLDNSTCFVLWCSKSPRLRQHTVLPMFNRCSGMKHTISSSFSRCVLRWYSDFIKNKNNFFALFFRKILLVKAIIPSDHAKMVCFYKHLMCIRSYKMQNFWANLRLERLEVSYSTEKSHLRRCFQKLGFLANLSSPPEPEIAVGHRTKIRHC